jgi:hypothetical protein
MAAFYSVIVMFCVFHASCGKIVRHQVQGSGMLHVKDEIFIPSEPRRCIQRHTMGRILRPRDDAAIIEAVWENCAAERSCPPRDGVGEELLHYSAVAIVARLLTRKRQMTIKLMVPSRLDALTFSGKGTVARNCFSLA